MSWVKWVVFVSSGSTERGTSLPADWHLVGGCTSVRHAVWCVTVPGSQGWGDAAEHQLCAIPVWAPFQRADPGGDEVHHARLQEASQVSRLLKSVVCSLWIWWLIIVDFYMPNSQQKDKSFELFTGIASETLKYQQSSISR